MHGPVKHPGRPVNIHGDRCLCGSGRLMRDCCLFVRCNTTPPGPGTGHAHPSCFARDLKDCSSTVTREHYISQSILGLFGPGGFTVSGMPWIPNGDKKRVSSASLTGKMLCERHNQALSPLDAVAAEFFHFFTAEWAGDGVDVFLTRGYDLERWLLKMMCGLVVSGNATLDGKRLSTWTPPPEWLEILFGSADVVTPAGLHYITANYQAAAASLLVVPLFKPATAHPIALVFAVEGIAFLFAMEEPQKKRDASVTRARTHYRPMALQLRRGPRVREAHFGWRDGELVTVNVRG